MSAGRVILFGVLAGSLACGGPSNPLGRSTPGATDTTATPDDDATNASATPELTHSTGGRSWTVLVYMVADNDLEPYAIDDLQEMMQVGSGEDFNLVVEIDRATGYSAAAVGGIPNFTSVKRLAVNAGSLTEISDLGELNMGDPRNLASFITWGVNAYPADKLALVLWDHGSAWPGFAADMASSYDALTLAELQSGIADGLEDTDHDRFTLVGFDACLMGSFETAIALRGSAEYLLASEELEPGHGWDYAALADIKDDPTRDAIALADNIITGFRAQALAQGTSASITLSLVDLYTLKAIERALQALTAKYATNLATAFGRARGQVLEFGREATAQDSAGMVDLGQVMLAIAELGSIDEPDAVYDAVHDSVMTQTRGSAMANATGLSVYWPTTGLYKSDYGSVPGIAAWRDLLAKVLDASSVSGTAPVFMSSTAAVSSQSGYLRFSAQLQSGTETNVTDEGMYYGLTIGSDTYLLGDTYGQLTGSGTVIADWDRTVLVVSQGAKQDYAYYSFQHGDNGTTVASVPFGYAASSTAPLETALLVAVYDGSGNLLQQTLYLATAAGYGQLTPTSGSELYPVYGVVTSNGIEWIASETTLNPQQALSFDFAPLSTSAANRSAYVLLYAQDYAGSSANATWGGKL